MTNFSRFHRRVVYVLDFYLPFPLTALMFWLWWARTGSAAFAAYTTAAGLIFGYLVPGIGTNLLGLWKFSGPWKLGSYYLHHGFLYAPYLSLVLYGCFGVWNTLTRDRPLSRHYPAKEELDRPGHHSVGAAPGAHGCDGHQWLSWASDRVRKPVPECK